jgi:hypothetical protein
MHVGGALVASTACHVTTRATKSSAAIAICAADNAALKAFVAYGALVGAATHIVVGTTLYADVAAKDAPGAVATVSVLETADAAVGGEIAAWHCARTVGIAHALNAVGIDVAARRFAVKCREAAIIVDTAGALSYGAIRCCDVSCSAAVRATIIKAKLAVASDVNGNGDKARKTQWKSWRHGKHRHLPRLVADADSVGTCKTSWITAQVLACSIDCGWRALSVQQLHLLG